MTEQRKTKACIITVGTEVSDGEIFNSNAQWLAQRLTDLHFHVIRHITVPDHTELITDALNMAVRDCALLIVTGGLGPTTDDFTRDVIASWSKRKLAFDPPSWERIVKRLTEMNVPVAVSNRQQCYFPEAARIIINPAGTANAFFLDLENDTSLLCLPGPPSEIKSIWQNGGEACLHALIPKENHRKLLYWHCIGVSESQLGEIVEDVLKGSGYTTGYRPNVPYVEIKVWVPDGRTVANDPYLQKLDLALKTCTVARQDEDVAVSCLQAVGTSNITISDTVTNGLIAARIGHALSSMRTKKQSTPHVSVDTSFDENAHSSRPSAQNFIWLYASDLAQVCKLEACINEKTIATEIAYNRKITPEGKERYLRFITEMMFVHLKKMLA